jgi:nicotinamidase-related amidase
MTNAAYPTDISALVLIDLLNDFLSPNGKADSRLAAQFEKVNFIPNVTRLLAGASDGVYAAFLRRVARFLPAAIFGLLRVCSILF